MVLVPLLEIENFLLMQNLDTILEWVDIKIDAGLRENRAISIRLFMFAMLFIALSMAGCLQRLKVYFDCFEMDERL